MSEEFDFLFLFVSSSLTAALYATTRLRRGVGTRAIYAVVLPASIIAIPVVGLGTGSFRSRGIDVPWWVLGLIGSVGILATTSLVIAIHTARKQK